MKRKERARLRQQARTTTKLSPRKSNRCLCRCSYFNTSKSVRTTVLSSKTLMSSTSFHLPRKHSVHKLRLRQCAGISANCVSLYHSSPSTHFPSTSSYTPALTKACSRAPIDGNLLKRVRSEIRPCSSMTLRGRLARVAPKTDERAICGVHGCRPRQSPW